MKFHPDKESMCSAFQKDSDTLNQIKDSFTTLWSYTKVEKIEH